MAVETQEQQQEQKPDIKALIEQRNQAEQAAKDGKVVEITEKKAPVPEKAEEKKPAETKKAAAAKPAGEEEEGDDKEPVLVPRHTRRELNKLRTENGELRGRLSVLEELVKQKPAAEEKKAPPDPEPQRKEFGSDAEYYKALGAWSARQETGKTLEKDREAQSKRQQQIEFAEYLEKMAEKADQDRAQFTDWEEVRQNSLDNGVQVNWGENQLLVELMARSDVQAAVMYHLAKHDDELEKLVALKDEPAKLIGAFHRLEGRIEKLYQPDPDAKKDLQGKDGKAAPLAGGAEKSKPEDRIPEKPAQGRDTTQQLPRPSREVAAKGGTAPEDDPPIGSAAWMAKRNAQLQTSRY